MVACDLDYEVSGAVLGWKLPAWQALLLHRVLPSCGGLIIYLTLICFDFALLYEHFQNGDEGLATFCLILMVLPSVISLVFTLASPPPGLHTELSAFSVNMERNDIRWIVMQFVNAIFFPIAAIGRYCFLIFWWVEAVCAARAQDEERTQEALLEARSPSPMELYLFLQTFIHSAPHAIFNILDLMTRYSTSTYDKCAFAFINFFKHSHVSAGRSTRDHECCEAFETSGYLKISIQAISIVASSLRMASTATLYRRFEREKICGRSYPWKIRKSEDQNHNADKENNKATDEADVQENIYEPILKRASNASQISYEAKNKLNSDLIQFSPRTTYQSATFYDHFYAVSDTSSDEIPPSPLPRSKKKSQCSSGFDSDDEYVRPVSIIDKVAPRRRDTEYTIEKVNITPPPLTHAPRPGSIAVWAEKLVENAEAIPAWLSAPPRRKYCDEVIHDEPDIPRRVPRSFIRGLEPEDATAGLVHYLGWYSFFVARLLSIACFINFFPVLAIILLFSHYQVMLLFLIVPQASSVKRGFYIFLAFIYLFCLMEFKIRFRHVRVWHAFWIIVCTVEIVLFIGLWASIDNSLNDWWRSFIVKVVIGSMFLSYMCFLMYFVLLKPRETIVYIKNNAIE